MQLLSSMRLSRPSSFVVFFFFNDTSTSEIYTLCLHDALPISIAPYLITSATPARSSRLVVADVDLLATLPRREDRKSTRLNSSHLGISYAVFCLKKKKKKK